MLEMLHESQTSTHKDTILDAMFRIADALLLFVVAITQNTFSQNHHT